LYERIYESSNIEVQNKIDENKIAGNDILAGIRAQHIVGIGGLNVSQMNELENSLRDLPHLFSFQLNQDMSSINIVSDAYFQMDDLSSVINALNGLITGQSTSYFVNLD
jgi:hypothetical protein